MLIKIENKQLTENVILKLAVKPRSNQWNYVYKSKRSRKELSSPKPK